MDVQAIESSIHVPAESEACAAELTASLLARIFAGYQPVDYAVHLWDGKVIPPASGQSPRFSFHLNHPGALRGMLFPPTVSQLGEAYMRKDFEIEGDMIAAMALGAALSNAPPSGAEWIGIGRDLLRLPSPPRSHFARPARLRGALHSAERDRAAVQYHYDLANEFYALWLDQRMVYSCAYFPTGGESLDAAQEAKLDLICRKLCLRPGETLLDIGCGWGGLSIYAARNFGVRVLGVTLSEKQAQWARERVREQGLQECVRIELRDYRELAGLSFDKIASIGMAEHVGAACLPAYFAHAYQLLNPRGLFLCQAIADEIGVTPDNRFTRLFEPNRFFRKYIFPDHAVVPLHVSAQSAAQAGFEVRDVEGLREHYALTVRNWLARLEASWDHALGSVPECTRRLWRLYLAMVAYAFQSRRLNLYQVLLAKPDAGGASAMPRTRADWYARNNG